MCRLFSCRCIIYDIASLLYSTDHEIQSMRWVYGIIGSATSAVAGAPSFKFRYTNLGGYGSIGGISFRRSPAPKDDTLVLLIQYIVRQRNSHIT